MYRKRDSASSNGPQKCVGLDNAEKQQRNESSDAVHSVSTKVVGVGEADGCDELLLHLQRHRQESETPSYRETMQTANHRLPNGTPPPSTGHRIRQNRHSSGHGK